MTSTTITPFGSSCSVRSLRSSAQGWISWRSDRARTSLLEVEDSPARWTVPRPNRLSRQWMVPRSAAPSELLLACDPVVASESATFGLPEAKPGLTALAGGLRELPRRVPYQLAMEMALTAAHISRACTRSWLGQPPGQAGRGRARDNRLGAEIGRTRSPGNADQQTSRPRVRAARRRPGARSGTVATRRIARPTRFQLNLPCLRAPRTRADSFWGSYASPSPRVTQRSGDGTQNAIASPSLPKRQRRERRCSVTTGSSGRGAG